MRVLSARYKTFISAPHLCLNCTIYSPQASWFLLWFILGLKGITWYYQDTWDEDPECIAVKSTAGRYDGPSYTG